MINSDFTGCGFYVIKENNNKMKKINNRLAIGFRLKPVGMRLLNKSKLKIQSKVLISMRIGFNTCKIMSSS